MSNYYNNKNRKRKKRGKKEKIGFYTAFSICLIAVCMAVYSTYNTISVSPSESKLTTPTKSVTVNQQVTGVTEPSTIEVPTLEAQTEFSADNSASTPDSKPNAKSKNDALETMLSTDISLAYPVESHNVLREYSKESTYFKTLNVWKPHTGVDFEATLGDDVTAMCDGKVTKVYDDKLFGKTVEISSNNVICIYSGLGSADLNKDDTVKSGDKIGVVGAVPFEASDKTHIHIALKVDGKYADPLSFIGNNE